MKHRCAMVVLAAVGTAGVWAEPTLEERLDRIVTRLEQERQTMHIPGMSLAIVHHDQVILARGFGQANIEKGIAADADTIYCIGSTTKAFTSTLIGMLQDDGVMSYDDPASMHVPGFNLQIKAPEPRPAVLVRDLLSHRSGFARMGMLSMGVPISFERTVYYMNRSEPEDTFREEFNYNNEMYLVAGVGAGRAAGSDWHTLLGERLLTPLGMTSTVSTHQAATSHPRIAQGYNWLEPSGPFEPLPIRDIDRCAPAGSIYSSVNDMAQWVRLQLGEGEFGGTRLVSEAAIAETRTPHITIQEGASYGLGWMLHEWEGRQVVEHGGNIDGFAAEVALIPEAELGFVLLTNVTATPLQGVSQQIIWEAMLTDWTAAFSGEVAPADLAGRYKANFGPFKDAWFNVTVVDGVVFVDVPGQTNYELAPPDGEGRRALKAVPGASISFQRDDDGHLTQLTLHQGADFELPREGVTPAGGVDASVSDPLIGEYINDQLGITLKVLVQNGRLAVDVPGQMVYELEQPDAEGKWAFRIAKQIVVVFDPVADGVCPSFTLTQSGRSFVHKRVGAAPEDTQPAEAAISLPTAERRAAIDAAGPYSLVYSVRIPSQGAEGTVTIDVMGRAYRYTQDFGDLGQIAEYFDGERGWSLSPYEPLEESSAEQIEEARLGHPDVFLGAWTECVDSTRVMPAEGDEVGVRVELSLSTGLKARLAVDPDTGDVLRIRSEVTAVRGLRVPFVLELSDHQEHHGLRVPGRLTLRHDGVGRIDMALQRVEVGQTFGPEHFRPADAPVPTAEQ